VVAVNAVRSVLYNVFYVAFTLACSLLFLPYLVLPVRFPAWALHLWAGGLIWGARLICGIRWRVEGLENLPDGPCIIAAKHQSAWETLFFPMLLGDVVYVLKKELLRIPFVGWYMAKSGMIAVDRTAGASALKIVLREAAKVLEKGRQIVIFPEGTRVAPDADHPYQPGAAALYARFGGTVPVIPVALNTGLFWGRRSFIKRPGDVVVRILPPLPRGLDKKTFTAELRKRIETESRRLCGLPAPGAGEDPRD